MARKLSSLAEEEGHGAQRHGGGEISCNTDTGLAFQGLFEPPCRGLWLRLLSTSKEGSLLAKFRERNQLIR